MSVAATTGFSRKKRRTTPGPASPSGKLGQGFVEPSLLRAVFLARGVPLPPTDADEHARYEVVLSSSRKRCEPQSFCTSVFRGWERVDLEDAFEMGEFDTVVVHKRRGEFSGREAGWVLRQVVLEDLSFEHMPFFSIAADRKQLTVKQLYDFEHTGKRNYNYLWKILPQMFRRCGGRARKMRVIRPNGILQLGELALELEDQQALVAIQLHGAPLHRIRRWHLRRLHARVFLVHRRQPFFERKAAAEGIQLCRFDELCAVLHAARIRMIERELGGKRRMKPLRSLT